MKMTDALKEAFIDSESDSNASDEIDSHITAVKKKDKQVLQVIVKVNLSPDKIHFFVLI